MGTVSRSRITVVVDAVTHISRWLARATAVDLFAIYAADLTGCCARAHTTLRESRCHTLVALSVAVVILTVANLFDGDTSALRKVLIDLAIAVIVLAITNIRAVIASVRTAQPALTTLHCALGT